VNSENIDPIDLQPPFAVRVKAEIEILNRNRLGLANDRQIDVPRLNRSGKSGSVAFSLGGSRLRTRLGGVEDRGDIARLDVLQRLRQSMENEIRQAVFGVSETDFERRTRDGRSRSPAAGEWSSARAGHPRGQNRVSDFPAPRS
jgi:hypothetical protein